MTTKTGTATGKRFVDDQMNEKFHLLLREAAERRERRQRLSATEDTEATGRESADFLALARKAPGKTAASGRDRT